LSNSVSVANEDRPIFIRGLSRSGGTLLVTLFDTHPQLAMSYELYPNLLEAGLSRDKLFALGGKLLRAWGQKFSLIHAPTGDMRTFISRAERGGVRHKRLGELFVEHCNNGRGIDSMEDRLQLIALCCKEKMRLQGKQYWGLKCNNNYEDYLAVWPQARFVNIIRDGRDVLASQMKTGLLKRGPAELARSWANTHRRFRALRDRLPEQVFEIKYEQLVKSPEQELKRLTGGLGLYFAPDMLRHNELDLTVYDSNHLSMMELRKPINEAKIGRWKQDVPRETMDKFLAEAAEALDEFGYEV
jgi:hypothetical protein